MEIGIVPVGENGRVLERPLSPCFHIMDFNEMILVRGPVFVYMLARTAVEVWIFRMRNHIAIRSKLQGDMMTCCQVLMIIFSAGECLFTALAKVI